MIKFIMWLIAMALAILSILFVWGFLSFFFVAIYGTYRNWSLYDHKYWMMPYYPIMWAHKIFGYSK